MNILTPSRLRALTLVLGSALVLAATSGAMAAPRDAARIFFSGHSLTDNPLPEDVAAIAQSLGTSARWNQQNIPGSPIAARTRGSGGWSGYSAGKNREGQGMNVVEELRRPRTLGGERYDTLVITERHDLVGPLIFEDSVRVLRHVHERLIEGNPQATTYFYESWLDVSDKNDPRAWITYERAASPAWQCMATRINRSLAAEGRSDRIRSLPAGAALADLVERATQGEGLPGITASSVKGTVDRLFEDNVHLTRMGSYYMALVSYATIYGRSPVGAWAPSGVSKEQAASLQNVAWRHVSSNQDKLQSNNLGQCRALMQASFCGTFWRFRGHPQHAPGCVSHFGRADTENPFYFDAAKDAAYWLPAP